MYEQIFKRTAELENKESEDALRAFLRTDFLASDLQTLVRVRQLVEGNKWMIPLVAEAVRRPKCRFKADWEHPFTAVYPYLRKLRNLGAFVGAEAVLDAKAGKTHEAVRKLELVFRMSDALKDEPSIIGQLLRAYIIGLGSSAFLTVARHTCISGNDARSLYNVIERVDLSQSAATAIAGERVSGMLIYNSLQELGPSVLGLSGRGEQSRPTYPMRVLLFIDELWFIQHAAAGMRASTLPYRKLVSGGGLSYLDADPPRYPPHLVSALITPKWSWILRKQDAIACLAGSRTLLSLQVYKNRFGAYPKTLAETATATGLECPIDPFSGRSLVYKKSGLGFILYSIGSDLVDNGGRPKKRNSSPVAKRPPLTPQQMQKEIENYKKPADATVSNDEQYDIVWKLDS